MSPSRVPQPVTIIGGGWLGSALAVRLAAPVVVTTRTGAWREGAAPPGIELRALDVVRDDSNAMLTTLAGTRSLVVCYAPGRGGDRRQLYVEGGERLSRVLEHLHLERLVYVGSTSALPDLDGPVDETCAIWPDHERGRIQREAEALFETRCRQLNIPWVIARLAGLYGPGRDLERIYQRRASAPLAGDGQAPTNLVHRDDAVTALVHALALDPTQSGVVHVCDDDHTPRREMYRRMAKRHGSAPVTWELDAAPGAPTRGKRVVNTRLKEWLGVRLRFPHHTPGA